MIGESGFRLPLAAHLLHKVCALSLVHERPACSLVFHQATRSSCYQGRCWYLEVCWANVAFLRLNIISRSRPDLVGVNPIADEVQSIGHSVGLTSLIQDEPPFLLMGYISNKTTARKLPHFAVPSMLAISCTEDRNTICTDVVGELLWIVD